MQIIQTNSLFSQSIIESSYCVKGEKKYFYGVQVADTLWPHDNVKSLLDDIVFLQQNLIFKNGDLEFLFDN